MSDDQNTIPPSGEILFKEKKKRRKKGGSDSLNINSMMDIMTILLVFLLVSVTSDPLSINQNTELRLAKMAGSCGWEKVDGTVKAVCKRAYRPPNDSIPITITKKTILVDNQDIDVQIYCRTSDGGVACTQTDLETKFKCGQQEDDLTVEPCSADELRRVNRMEFYVDRLLKQGSSDESFLIEKLGNTLEEKVKQIRESKEGDSTAKFVPAATIIADADIPFRVIAEVIYTAGMAKLTDMRFALLQRESR
jgi:biopolymer transport protein ExbD